MTAESAKKTAKSRLHERGVALIMVLSTLTLVSLVVTEFTFDAMVEYRVAVNAQDDLQAYNNALTAMRLRALILRQSSKLESTIKGLLGALGMGSSTPPIAQTMQMIPLDCNLLSGLFKFKDSKLLPTSAIEEANERAAAQKDDDEEGDEVVNPVFMGECSSELTSEHSKMSVNILRNNSGSAAAQTIQRLLLALSTKEMEHHFEEDDANGTHADSPEELLAALKDWIDDDSEETNGSADEDRRYQYLNDSYKAKNAPFDSVEEIQLIHGIDDELWEILQDKFTIYTQDGTIDAATASMDQILFALGFCINQGVDPLHLQTHPGLALFMETLQLARIPGLSFTTVNSAYIISILTDAQIIDYFDQACIKNSFAEKSGNTWYRINAMGTSGNVTRHIIAIFQAGEGKFYYWREE